MSGWEIEMDPRLIDVVKRLYDDLTENPGELGLDWRVVIERNDRPAAAIERSRDRGVRVMFFGDEGPAFCEGARDE